REHFAQLTPQEQREALQALPLEKQQELLQTLPLEVRLAGLPPEVRLAGLSAGQIRQYLDQLTAPPPAQPRKPRRHKERRERLPSDCSRKYGRTTWQPLPRGQVRGRIGRG